MPSYYEFFSGGGMARLGLGDRWDCMLSNDICPKKVSTYRENFGGDEVVCEDIYKLTSIDLPGHADLIWGSFPCQDLSLAGSGAGLKGERSGTFNKVVGLISDLKEERRAPKVIVLENVVGAITSHGGKDFTHIISSLVELGYSVGCVVVDGVLFVPQSRPRLFVVATSCPKNKLGELSLKSPDLSWHPANLIQAQENLPDRVKRKWVWWGLPTPERRREDLVDIIEQTPGGVEFLSRKDVRSLLGMMSDVNLEKITKAKGEGRLVAGGLYKRVRKQKDGIKLQRAEVRFDGVAGCLRTPTGGSSRQTIVLVDGDEVSARLLSSREAARLMGVPEDYVIPKKYNDAYHVFGDGLVVPVVSWLEQHLLMPIFNIE